MKRYRHYTKDRAIVLSCFGSIIEQSKYEELKLKLEQKFSDSDVFLAFSSRMVLKKLNKDKVIYKNLPQTLADVDILGYKNIVVSSINLFPTDEHNYIQNIADGFDSFSLANIRLSDAILTKTKETTLFLNELNQKVLKQVSKKDVANLYIIHGTPRLDNSGNSSVEYVFNYLQSFDNNFCCSLEGTYPYYAIKDNLISKIKNKGFEKVQIVPLLLVSGNHFIKDMNEIKEELNSEFEASIVSSLTKSQNFNLIELDSIVDIISSNIATTIAKLGV